MYGRTDFDPRQAELVHGIPTALNQTGYRLTAAELVHFNGRPKKADRLPRMRPEAKTAADIAEAVKAGKIRRHLDGGHGLDGMPETVRRSDINHAP